MGRQSPRWQFSPNQARRAAHASEDGILSLGQHRFCETATAIYGMGLCSLPAHLEGQLDGKAEGIKATPDVARRAGHPDFEFSDLTGRGESHG